MEPLDLYIGLGYLVTLMAFAAVVAARRDTRVHVEKKIPYEAVTEEEPRNTRRHRQPN